jgi:ERCC4-type nuclease
LIHSFIHSFVCSFIYSNSSSKSLLPDLIKNGVTCELRLLSVGDLLWIAREKVPPHFLPGIMGNAPAPARKELVLNYVVERKRMDDLVSSMISGRLREQKVILCYVSSVALNTSLLHFLWHWCCLVIA